MEKLKIEGNGDARLSVIIPTLNEARNITETICRLKQVGCRDILIIDGNSVDGTVESAQRLGAKVVMQHGKGKGSALRQAFGNGYVDGDIIIVLDADGSMDPEEIPSFVDAIRSGAEIVKGSRFLPKGQSDDITAMRKVGNKLLVSILNFLFLTKYTDLCYGYMAFRKEAIKRISPRLTSEDFEIETEICIRAKELGIKVAEVPSFERARRYGESNLHSFKDGFRILRVIVRESLLGGTLNDISSFDNTSSNMQ
jgi:glycosyltransferase involved in cell wall biosynthesis